MSDELMSERVTRVRLHLADKAEKEIAAIEYERTEKVLQIAVALADEVEQQEAEICLLLGEGVTIGQLRPNDQRRAANAKRQLNTSATHLKDVARKVKSVVDSKALEDALSDLEHLVRVRRDKARTHAQSFVDKLRPTELVDVNPNLISSNETRRNLMALQRCFEPMSESTVDQLVSRVRKAKVAVSAWEEQKNDIESAIDRVPTEVRTFLTRVRSGPVNWNEVPAVVRQWLDERTNGQSFQITQVKM